MPSPDSAQTQDWGDHRVLLAVLERGGLAAGALNLGLSEQSVRKHIRHLEDACGFPLFSHGVRGLTPTAAGVSLGRHAAAMRDAANGVGMAVADAAPPRHRVTVIATELLGHALLTPVFQDLARNRPDIAIDLSIHTAIFDRLVADADIGVLLTPAPGDAQPEDYVGALDIGLYGRRDMVEARGAPTGLAELRQFTLIGSESRTTTERFLTALALDLSHADFHYRTDSMIGGATAIRAGVGIGVGYVALLGEDPSLIRVLPEIGGCLPVWMIVLTEGPPDTPVGAVALAIRARLKGLVHDPRGPTS